MLPIRRTQLTGVRSRLEQLALQCKYWRGEHRGASGKWELKGGGGSIYSGVTAGAVASGASGNVTVSGVGTVSVYNQWSTTIAKAKKCLIGWVANESRYQFVSVEC